jgi:hypothetical protein
VLVGDRGRITQARIDEESTERRDAGEQRAQGVRISFS